MKMELKLKSQLTLKFNTRKILEKLSQAILEETITIRLPDQFLKSQKKHNHQQLVKLKPETQFLVILTRTARVFLS